MEKIERARVIVDQVLALEPRVGRDGPPRAHHTIIPTRLIKGEPRWEARISRGYEKGPNGGEKWDLFELFIYGQQRMTAALRGPELILRQYLPGAWEPIFLITPTFDTVPLLPNTCA